MVRTIPVQGTDEVMAMFGAPGIFYRGKWEDILVTGVSPDPDVPLEVRTALVGLRIPTIFTKEGIERQTRAHFPIPEGSRLAYCTDVIAVLQSAGKPHEAEQLRKTAPEVCDMYTIDSESYTMVQARP